MNKLKLLLTGALCASFAMTGVACGDTKDDVSNALQLSKTAVFLDEVGATHTVKARTEKEGDKISWTSSNQQVATVQDGVITAKGNGITTIKVKANGKTATCNVIVGKIDFDLTAQTVALTAGQTQSIEADLTLSGEEIADVAESYSSKNVAVATVSNEGLVNAVASGETTLSVSAVYFGKTFTKELNLKVSSVPEVSIYEEAVITAVGQKYKINASLLVDGEEAEDYTLQYESADATVATVSADGVVSGVKKGETQVKVKASCGGQTYEKSVAVTVNNNVDIDVAMNATNVTMVPSDRLIAGKINQFDLQLTVSKNGEAVTGKSVTWTIEDESIATLSGNGYGATVKAKGVGETTVIATIEHNGETLQVKVNVICETPVFDAADFTIDASKQSGTDIVIVAPTDIDVEEIDEILFGGKALTVLSKNAEENSMTVKNAGFAMGAEKISVKSGITVYNSQIVYATKVIRTQEDFVNFATNYKSNKAGEYYVLAADIDMGGKNISKLQGYDGGQPGETCWTGDKVDWKGESVVAWNARFDGRGYAIKNAKFIGGIFSNLGSAAIVENLAIIDCTHIGSKGGYICNDSGGIVRNCYIKGTLNGMEQGAFMMTLWPQGNLNNCVAVVSEREGSAHGTNAAIGGSGQGVSSNLYVVTTDRNELGGKDGNGQIFASVSDLNNAGVGKTLTGEYWKVVNGQLYFGNHLVG